jgi:RNA polymerase sigma-70 factor, ECF subfamily
MTALTSDRIPPEQKSAARELNTILEAAIDELSETYRIVLMLRDVEALSTAETAECLGLSEEAVRVRLHHATAQLREKLFERVGAAAAQTFPFHDSRSDRVVTGVFEAIRDLQPEWSATHFAPVTSQSAQTSRALEKRDAPPTRRTRENG